MDWKEGTKVESCGHFRRVSALWMPNNLHKILEHNLENYINARKAALRALGTHRFNSTIGESGK